MSGQKTLLLVEDEFLLAMTETRQIENEGYKVIQAYSGENAIEVMSKEPRIDLVLMDIDLGSGMDGTEAAEIILKDHDVPVLFLSSHTEKEIVEKTEKITNYGYVVKNSSFTVLDASIKMAFKLFQANSGLKKREIEARERERYLETVINTTQDGYYVLDEHGKFLEANLAYCEITGFSREEILLLSIFDIKPETDREPVIPRLEAIVHSGFEHFESRIRRKDGHERTIEVSTSWMPSFRHFTAYCRDITRRRDTENALKESEHRFRTAFSNAPIGISLTEFDGRLSSVNQAYCNMLGYSMEEINKTTFIAITHPDDVAMSLEHTKKLHDGEYETVRFEKRYIHKDGHTVWADISMAIMRDSVGKPLNFIAQIIDVSYQKAQEAELKASESRLRKAQAVAHVGSWQWFIKSNRLKWSDEMYRIFGIDWEHFTGFLPDVIEKAIHPEDREKVNASNKSSADGKSPIPLEYRIIWADGSIHTVWGEAGELVLGEDGEPDYLTGIVQDITEKARDRAKKDDEAELFRASFHTNAAMSLLIDQDTGAISDANGAASEFYGYSIEKLRSMNIDEINTLPEAQVRNEMFKAQAKRQSYFIFKHKLSDGSIRDVEVYSSPLDVHGKKILHSIVHDISDRVEAEGKLKRSETKLLAILKNSQDAIGVHLDGVWEICNPAAVKMFGVDSEDDLLGKPIVNVLDPNERSKVAEYVRKRMTSEEAPLCYITKGLRKDGTTFEMEVDLSSYQLEEKRHVLVILRDISEKEKAARAVKESQEKLRAIFDAETDSIVIADRKTGVIIDCNASTLAMHGCSRDELVGHLLSKNTPEPELMLKALNSNDTFVPLRYITRKDGSVVPVEISKAVAIIGGNEVVIAASRDISYRLAAERKLKDSEEKYRLLFDNMLEGFALQEIITDEQGKPVDFRFIDANPSYERYTGQKPSDIIGKTMLEVIPNAEKSQIEAYGHVALTGEPLSFEYYSKTYNRHFWIKSFRPQAGRFATIFEDISERKNTELEIHQKSLEVSAILSTVTAGVSRVKNRRTVWANPAHDSTFGYEVGETIGLETSALYPNRESFDLLGEEAYPQLATGKAFVAERLMKKKNGELFWCSLTGKYIDKDKPEEGSIWMIRDISDRKHSETELQAALHDNQNLLHEIQHRAKNSFNMISSMIGLAVMGEAPEQAIPILQELDNRVRSIAELYSMLYSSGSFSEVRLDEYGLKVISSLMGLKPNVAADTRLEKVTIQAREAAPIGLILTELVTNAIKYAFPDGRKGKVTVSLRQNGSEKILEIEDDGIGLPVGFGIEHSSGMGIKLITGLAGQIGGTFSIANGKVGTKARLVWTST